jgi:ubiquinone/menaquinone biosynthesis C-methylase UbiE
MTETTAHPDTGRPFVPGLGVAALTPLYDLVHRASRLGGVHADMLGLADLRAGLRVLDVGCGTGNLLLALGRRRLGVELVGLDPDLRALTAAGRKAGRAGVAVDWRRGFAQQLPFPDASVDRVFSSLMLHHLDPPAKDELLAEVRRVLRPGGLLVLADMDGHDGAHDGRHGHNPFARRMAARLHDNAGVPDRIAAAGFELDPPLRHRLGRLGEITVVRAHRGS